MEDHWAAPFTGSGTFRTDIREEKDRYLIEAELPGIAREDISVEVEQQYVTIRAKRHEYTEQKDDANRVLRQERRSGEFARRFYVGQIDEDGIKAKLEQGVLRLELPKRLDTEHRKQIRID
ncbi:Hsp20/alpha crystallin family protein [Paenibacillus sp. SYP-B4298]|uniref:Hsp20/alpha crystallin family protein n=1 Tax=Paenibacillus sp. SYP-B4298 TaxID=2996034 RepID=UPI0022DDAEEE|nr:Hsp20/alpha crystallin family protein [Paenibacillus sp. SYP-B4298]